MASNPAKQILAKELDAKKCKPVMEFLLNLDTKNLEEVPCLQTKDYLYVPNWDPTEKQPKGFIKKYSIYNRHLFY